MSKRIVSTNIRFNLEKEMDRTAWEHLQQRDKREYRSYSKAVIAAVNDYFERRGGCSLTRIWKPVRRRTLSSCGCWKPSGPGAITPLLSVQRLRCSTCCRISHRNRLLLRTQPKRTSRKRTIQHWISWTVFDTTAGHFDTITN